MTNKQYHLCLKRAANMKLSSDAFVLKITYEGLTNFQYFMEFDSNITKSLSKSCIKNIDSIIADVPNEIASENAFPGTNIRIILI